MPGYFNYVISCFPQPRADSAPFVTLNYTGVIHIGGANIDIKGKTNDAFRSMYISAKSGTADINITYKNKNYTFSAKFDLPV